MPVCGIIAEFNPFHNGHQALIDAARKNGATQIVCVMSGNFVERGSLAVTDKRIRAKAALQCGADLIIELPLAHAMSSAQRFSKGSVFLLKALGCTDMLAFGSECGSISDLSTLAKAIDDIETTEVMRKLLGDGITFAKARELAIKQIYGEELSMRLREPNNILGVEYLRQLNLQNLKAEAFTIKRVGAHHHDHATSGCFASASYLRESPNMETLTRFVPERAAKIYTNAISDGLFPSDQGKLEISILSQLRRMSLAELASLPDVSEGLHNRMYSAIRTAGSLDGLAQNLKTKRYTMARVRRLILSAFLGLTASDPEIMPPYIRLLGFSPDGQKLLSQIKQKCTLPISASLSDLRALGGTCKHFATLEERSTDLYGLSLPKPLPCGFEYTAQAIFLKEI